MPIRQGYKGEALVSQVSSDKANGLSILANGITTWRAFSRRDRNHSQRAARALHDLQRRGDHHCARGRQLIEIAKARKAEASASVHYAVIGKRRIERRRAAGI